MARVALPALLACGLAATTARAEPATHTVVIEGMKYSPSALTVQVGDTVVFRNADLVPHTATEKSSKAFDSGILNPNGEWKLVATKSGTMNYKCTLHPGMEGSLIVKPGPSSSPQ